MSELATLEGEEDATILFDSPLYGGEVELSGDELGFSFGKGFGGFGKGFGKSFSNFGKSFSRAGRSASRAASGAGRSLSRAGRGFGKSSSSAGKGIGKGFQSAGKSFARLNKQAFDFQTKPFKDLAKFGEHAFKDVGKGLNNFLQPGQGMPEEDQDMEEDQTDEMQDQEAEDQTDEMQDQSEEIPDEQSEEIISEDAGEEMNGEDELGFLEFLPVAEQGLNLLSNVSRGTNQGKNFTLQNVLSSISPQSKVRVKKSTLKKPSSSSKNKAVWKSGSPVPTKMRDMGPDAPSGKPDDDKNKTMYIVGGVAAVGVLAFIMMNKKGRR